MKLGTVVFENAIYNLDYMNIDEMKVLLNNIEQSKKKNLKQIKEVLKNENLEE